jgi:hypothetical protein
MKRNHIQTHQEMGVQSAVTVHVQARRYGSTVGAVGATVRLALGLRFATGSTPPTAPTALVFVL